MGAQLASLPVNPDDRPLRALQVQLLAALERRTAPPPPPRPAYVPSELGHDRLEVMEISASEWAAASQILEDGPGRGP